MLPFVDPTTLDAYAEAGVERLILPLPSATADDVLPVLDEHAPLVARYRC
jgi:hypothetical protein